MDTNIPGYVYMGDMGSVADHGGKWLGITRENLGHVIECVGAADLDEAYCQVTAGQLYVRGHVEMRRALDTCGWSIRDMRSAERRAGVTTAAMRETRRAMMLEAYHNYNGLGDTPDHCETVDADAATADQDVIDLANRWAR